MHDLSLVYIEKKWGLQRHKVGVTIEILEVKKDKKYSSDVIGAVFFEISGIF